MSWTGTKSQRITKPPGNNGPSRETVSVVAAPGKGLGQPEVANVISRACLRDAYQGKKVLLIVPDGTRTAPIGLLFKELHRQIGDVTATFDVLVALGTHQPMSEAAICQRIEISDAEHASSYARVKFFNHAWDDPGSLRQVGTLRAEE